MFDFDMPPLDWRTAVIPKKSGGIRKLRIPNDELKRVQRDILNYLYTVKELRPSGFAHGFVPFRNTCTGAMRHDRKAEVILCMDVQDFFDNFPVEPVRQALLNAHIGRVLTDKIITACTCDGSFPQGGPCSPYLTNIGMKEVDLLISAYAANNGFNYSRYADDIALSRDPHTTVPEKRNYKHIFFGVEKILKERLGLHLKHKKDHTIWLHSKKAPRRITGVVIRKDGTGYNAPMKMRKLCRAMLHRLYQRISDRNGVVLDSDWVDWRKVLGYVQYFDRIRAYSEPESATADPKIPENQFNYLAARFGMKRRTSNENIQ